MTRNSPLKNLPNLMNLPNLPTRPLSPITVIDSHTGGEPTRVVIDGFPDLGAVSMQERLVVLRSQHDAYRAAIMSEPRGNEVLVGAVLCPPINPAATTGVIFFNNVGYLGMCGHGTIGLIVTLAYLNRIQPGAHRIETPVGEVIATLHDTGAVSVANVPSYRHLKDVQVDVPGIGKITGDVAWGGNWFFLVNQHGQELDMHNIERLTAVSWAIREQLRLSGITGRGGAHIDHIELFGRSGQADSKSFVLCPGKAYDRSPCGTGTSAKLACLIADGKLAPGQLWRQESIIGSIFEASATVNADGSVTPTIKGTAYITGEAKLILQANDPFVWGIKN